MHHQKGSLQGSSSPLHILILPSIGMGGAPITKANHPLPRSHLEHRAHNLHVNLLMETSLKIESWLKPNSNGERSLWLPSVNAVGFRRVWSLFTTSLWKARLHVMFGMNLTHGSPAITTRSNQGTRFQTDWKFGPFVPNKGIKIISTTS